eukprot:TRINITY_DN4092_c0_g1_i2.p1 TRINITY_DN4092_c0_g1~~TRINITY_DN4092_c0_g1_i2.p1  ORF type:complete len:148 (-),score=24.08 TRINITY_DN4092_c0_g1_i2:103-546(-)
MTSLQQLGFDKNSLTGSIPQTFQRLALLQSLFLQDNQLQGGLDSLVGLVNLKYGYLSRNQITGTIPTALGNIRTLQQLGIDSNRISGTIPTEFGLDQNFLQSFYAQYNLITGTFNKNLCHVPNCDCSGNTFSCPIPNPPCCSVYSCV